MGPQAPHPPLSAFRWSSARMFLHRQATSLPSAHLLPLRRKLDGSGATPAMELGESPVMILSSSSTPRLSCISLANISVPRAGGSWGALKNSLDLRPSFLSQHLGGSFHKSHCVRRPFSDTRCHLGLGPILGKKCLCCEKSGKVCRTPGLRL